MFVTTKKSPKINMTPWNKTECIVQKIFALKISPG